MLRVERQHLIGGKILRIEFPLPLFVGKPAGADEELHALHWKQKKPSWKLGWTIKLPFGAVIGKGIANESGRQDLNLRPLDPQSSVLNQAELRPGFFHPNG